MIELAYTCRARGGAPYECGAGEHWLILIVTSLFGLVGVVYLVVMAFLWLTDLERPWRRKASRRAWQERQFERARLERDRERRAAEPPQEVPEAFRRRGPGQPW